MKKSLSFPLIALALSGCAKNIDYHGHFIHVEDLEGIVIGQSTKDEVASKLGTPSSVSTFHDNQWYYISETRERVAFFIPKTVESQVTVVNFDDEGRVAGIDFRGDEHREKIAHVQRETPTSGHSFGFFEQMFGNVGRFGGVDPDAPASKGPGG